MVEQEGGRRHIEQRPSKRHEKGECKPRVDANECAFCDSHGKLTGG